MLILTKIELFIYLFVILKETLCFCEESFVVICDNLIDIKRNDTWPWRYVIIGSTQNKHNPPTQILNSRVMLDLVFVKSLTIIYQIESIDSTLLASSCKNLQYLNLYDNNIKFIEDETFEDFPSLRELYLENNHIEYLGRSVFKNSTLDVVSLSRNLIETITTCFFQSKIKWLKINHNKLKFIRAGAFPITLERLELEHNFLTSLNEGVFKNLRNLKELSMKHNRLTSLPDISSLWMIHYLHLSYNNIKEIIYQFDQHKELEYVDLSSNLIRNISVDGISWNSTPPMIILTFNRLINLKFEHPERKTDLVIYGNPWICDCLFNIEKTIREYKHIQTCELPYFKNGKLPMCIENGKCGENEIDDSVINNFIEIVSTCENKNQCNFHLENY
ncbi:LRR 8 domain containing protein [Asbolus verrucosus]|uniref:LRR 8 domain containing protein n=1 Tax=Asbolus verrucosus TaxID=1661398 RepID=A0A482W217_ASBVE|nr:LRR 8 domain containing protein [Asbolus verrucosus]